MCVRFSQGVNKACLQRKTLNQVVGSSLDPAIGRDSCRQTNLGLRSFFVNSGLISFISYLKENDQEKITSISFFFFLYKRISIVGQFGRKQKQANITKSVFIHGDIVSIYKHVQYKNVREAYVPSHPSKLHCTQGKQPVFFLRVYRQMYYIQHAGGRKLVCLLRNILQVWLPSLSVENDSFAFLI